MKKHKFLLSFLVLLFIACSDDNEVKDENPLEDSILIFGWFADSSCSGHCSQIYKIENSEIYRDIDVTYPDGVYFESNFQLIENIDFEDYEVLLEKFPGDLFNKPNGYLDCSECTNANGGFYLEIQNDQIHKSWRFRNARYPEYMESYRSILLDKLAKLNSM